NNGGVTSTHSLLSGSPAIDAGNTATCAPNDQRGAVRPVGAACDIGAYEASGVVTIPATPAQVVSVNTAFGALSEGTNRVGYVNFVQVAFSNDMSDPAGNSSTADVTNPANYMLVGDGTDGLFQTMTCSAQDNDIVISIDSVSYDSAA